MAAGAKGKTRLPCKSHLIFITFYYNTQQFVLGVGIRFSNAVLARGLTSFSDCSRAGGIFKIVVEKVKM